MVRAENAGPFTLDGTRTFIVGRDRVVIVDPGPDVPRHLERVAKEVRGAESGWILLTHGHPDHAAGTRTLARMTGFPVGAPLGGVDRHLEGGDEVPADGGALIAVATPGHARHHLAFHCPRDGGDTGGDLFVGDLLLGVGRTTWVGEYPGCVADYLASLDRVERLAPDRILPAHGPVIERPLEVVSAFRDHRRARIEAVVGALADLGHRATLGKDEEVWPLVETLVKRVYRDRLEGRPLVGARWSVRAILEYLGVAPFPPEGAPSEGGGRLAPGS